MLSHPEVSWQTVRDPIAARVQVAFVQLHSCRSLEAVRRSPFLPVRIVTGPKSYFPSGLPARPGLPEGRGPASDGWFLREIDVSTQNRRTKPGFFSCCEVRGRYRRISVPARFASILFRVCFRARVGQLRRPFRRLDPQIPAPETLHVRATRTSSLPQLKGPGSLD